MSNEFLRSLRFGVVRRDVKQSVTRFIAGKINAPQEFRPEGTTEPVKVRGVV
jgi:hypothetical protein